MHRHVKDSSFVTFQDDPCGIDPLLAVNQLKISPLRFPIVNIHREFIYF